MQLETKFVKGLQRSAKAVGLIEFKVHGHLMQRAGWPDLEVLLWGGRTLYLEAKVQRNWLDPLQEEILGQMRKRGHAAGVIRKEDGDIVLYLPDKTRLITWEFGEFTLSDWEDIWEALC